MNNQDLIVMIMNPTIQVAMIVGVVEVLKRAGINKKALPIIDVVLGLVFGIVVYGCLQEMGAVQGVLIGIALGLSACGLFSGIKNIAQHEGECGTFEPYEPTQEEEDDLIGQLKETIIKETINELKRAEQDETYTFEEVAEALDIDTGEQEEPDSEEEEADAEGQTELNDKLGIVSASEWYIEHDGKEVSECINAGLRKEELRD